MNKGLIVHTVIFNNKNEVLITRRSSANDVLSEYWDIPGGTLEDGENPQIGATREAKEETNLDVHEPCLFFQKSNVDAGKNKQFVTLVFLAKYSSGEVKLNPEEHDEFKWINISDISSYKTVDYLADALNFLASQKHSILKF